MRRTRLCLEGICFLVITGFIVGGAMIREINLLLVVAGILIGVFLISLRLLIRSLGRMEVLRSMPHAVGAGEPFTVRLNVANRKRNLGAWGVLASCDIERILPTVENAVATVRMFFPFIAAGSDAGQTCDCCLHDRGVYRFGPMHLSSRFPLGLVRRTVCLGEVAQVVVYPKLGQIQQTWLESLPSRQLGDYQTQHRSGLTEGEFHGLRNWRQGDSARWIHWRTTAKRNRLTIREFERQRNHDLAVLLDLRAVDLAEEPCERAIRFVATLIASHCRKGRSQLTLGVAGESVEIVHGVSSTGFMRECMEKLAMATSTHVDVLPQLLCRTLSTLARETRIVAVSAQSINLRDTNRFAVVWDQPPCRHLLPRIACVAMDDPRLNLWYADYDERDVAEGWETSIP